MQGLSVARLLLEAWDRTSFKIFWNALKPAEVALVFIDPLTEAAQLGSPFSSLRIMPAMEGREGDFNATQRYRQRQKTGQKHYT